MAMNPEVKARWVAALRSGEYRQAQGRLKDINGFCCLGVLCDLFVKESGNRTWKAKSMADSAEPRRFQFYEHREDALPHPPVLIWAGLDPEQKVCIGRERDYLYNHNDSGRTFAEIADAIESQL